MLTIHVTHVEEVGNIFVVMLLFLLVLAVVSYRSRGPASYALTVTLILMMYEFCLGVSAYRRPADSMAHLYIVHFLQLLMISGLGLPLP